MCGLAHPKKVREGGRASDPNSRKDNDAAALDACIFASSLCRDAQGTSLLNVRADAFFSFCGNEFVTGSCAHEVYNCADSLVPGRWRRSGSVLAFFLKLFSWTPHCHPHQTPTPSRSCQNRPPSSWWTQWVATWWQGPSCPSWSSRPS